MSEYILDWALRQAIKVEDIHLTAGENFIRPVNYGPEKKFKFSEDLDEVSENEGESNSNDILYQLLLVYGDNFEFLKELELADMSKTELFVFQSSGYASQRIAEICRTETQFLEDQESSLGKPIGSTKSLVSFTAMFQFISVNICSVNFSACSFSIETKLFICLNN